MLIAIAASDCGAIVLRQQHAFGRRGEAVNQPQPDPVSQLKSSHEEADGYENPVLTRFLATRPWPACAAFALVLVSFGGPMVLFADKGLPPIGFFPVMLIVGFVMYLQFRGMQAHLNGKEERVRRAVSARYPLVPVLGMIAGLIYFMVTRQQSPADILTYDWVNAFGGPVDIEAPAPLPVDLVENMGSFGGAGLFLGYLWYRTGKYFSDET